MALGGDELTHWSLESGTVVLKCNLWNCPQVNATRSLWWLFNIGSVNYLIPSGNKSLPGPMLTHIGHNKLMNKWLTGIKACTSNHIHGFMCHVITHPCSNFNSSLTHLSLVLHIYIEVNLVSIGLDNGLSPIRHQAIIWTNATLLFLRNKLQWNFNQNIKLFIHENASENIVCEMAAILPRGRWVNVSCSNFNSGYVKPMLKLGHGLLITLTRFCGYNLLKP